MRVQRSAKTIRLERFRREDEDRHEDARRRVSRPTTISDRRVHVGTGVDGCWDRWCRHEPGGSLDYVNNDALVAALGPDTVAAVHGYRLAVLREAERRGPTLVSEPLSDVMQLSPGGCVVVDPVDIRLTSAPGPRPRATGPPWRWCPAGAGRSPAACSDPPP